MRQFTRVCEILEQNHYDPCRLIPILQAIQSEYRYLPKDIMAFTATSLNLSPAEVFGVATFYSHFALEPKGKYILRMCDGTACHVKNSTKIIETIRQYLGLSETKKTTSDLLFTFETVACLGACGLAPVLVINEEVHGQMTPEKALELVKEIQAKEAPK